MTLHRREATFTATGGTASTEDWSLTGDNDGSGVELPFSNKPVNVWRVTIDDTGITASSPTLGVLDEEDFDLSPGAPGTEDHYTTDVEQFRGRLVDGNLFVVGDDLAEDDVVRVVIVWEH